jgi:hypothetical protein
MLRRDPGEGRRREQFCRKSLPCPAGLSRGGCLTAAGRFRPSQWREGAGTCARLSGEWVLSVAPTAASGWPAKLCVQPGVPNSVSAPRGALWAAMSGTVARGHRPGRGLPSRPGTTLWPSQQRRRASESESGAGGRGSVRRVLGRPAASCQYPGDWESQSSPRLAASPPKMAPGGHPSWSSYTESH